MTEEFKPIETQEAFDAAIKERIERAERKASERFSDYDELKAKVKSYEDAAEAGKTDLEKLQEKVAAMEADKAARDEADKLRACREKVSKKTGVPADIIAGATEGEMESFAQAVAKFAKKPAAPASDAAGKFAAGGAAGSSDLSDFAAKLFGGDR